VFKTAVTCRLAGPKVIWFLSSWAKNVLSWTLNVDRQHGLNHLRAKVACRLFSVSFRLLAPGTSISSAGVCDLQYSPLWWDFLAAAKIHSLFSSLINTIYLAWQTPTSPHRLHCAFHPAECSSSSLCFAFSRSTSKLGGLPFYKSTHAPSIHFRLNFQQFHYAMELRSSPFDFDWLHTSRRPPFIHSMLAVSTEFRVANSGEHEV
jgi:hypothetical protein